MNWERSLRLLVREPGKVIWAVSFSLINLRVLAGLASDKVLRFDIAGAGDFYKNQAAMFFSVGTPNLWQRTCAQETTFVQVTGGDLPYRINKLREKVGVSELQAKRLLEHWGIRYSSSCKYLHGVAQRALVQGGITSYHGRLTPFEKGQAFAYKDRLARDLTVRNTAYDLAKTGFCNLVEDPTTKDLEIEILTVVHDKLLFSTPEGAEPSEIREHLQRCLVKGNDPNFDLKLDISAGRSWGDAQT
jgi:DNA polymerase I-like protein with 3'-5' exonuclease and polymerase domains